LLDKDIDPRGQTICKQTFLKKIKKIKKENGCRHPQFESLMRMLTSSMAKKEKKKTQRMSTSTIQICEADVDIPNDKKNETDVDIRNSNLQSRCRHSQ